MIFSKRTLSKIVLPAIPLVALTVLFEFLCRSGQIAAYVLPAPSKVWIAFFETQGEFLAAFSQTLIASLIGLGLSVTVGLMIAIVLSISNLARDLFYPYAVFFQTVPIIAIAPLLVIWFGYGMPTVIASSFIVSVFPIIANTVLGFLSTDPNLLQLFRLMGASPGQTLIRLRIPFALPQILSGIKISSGLAVIGAIVGEFISGNGLGGVVDAARNQQRVDRVFAAVVLASFLGILFFGAISFLNSILLRHWHPSTSKE